MAATLVMTRPQEAAQRFVDQLAVHIDLPEVLFAPAFEIVAQPFDDTSLAQATGVVLTSEHAVGAAGAGCGRPAYCVGPRTAAAARRAGFDVRAEPGDAARLRPILDALPDLLRRGLVHPHGAELAADMGVPGVVVYGQPACPAPAPVVARLSDPTERLILPLFSPRSAKLVGGWVRPLAAVHIVAISQRAAEAWPHTGAKLSVADHPNAGGMLQAVIDAVLGERSARVRVERSNSAR